MSCNICMHCVCTLCIKIPLGFLGLKAENEVFSRLNRCSFSVLCSAFSVGSKNSTSFRPETKTNATSSIRRKINTVTCAIFGSNNEKGGVWPLKRPVITWVNKLMWRPVRKVTRYSGAVTWHRRATADDCSSSTARTGSTGRAKMQNNVEKWRTGEVRYSEHTHERQ